MKVGDTKTFSNYVKRSKFPFVCETCKKAFVIHSPFYTYRLIKKGTGVLKSWRVCRVCEAK